MFSKDLYCIHVINQGLFGKGLTVSGSSVVGVSDSWPVDHRFDTKFRQIFFSATFLPAVTDTCRKSSLLL